MIPSWVWVSLETTGRMLWIHHLKVGACGGSAVDQAVDWDNTSFEGMPMLKLNGLVLSLSLVGGLTLGVDSHAALDERTLQISAMDGAGRHFVLGLGNAIAVFDETTDFLILEGTCTPSDSPGFEIELRIQASAALQILDAHAALVGTNYAIVQNIEQSTVLFAEPLAAGEGTSVVPLVGLESGTIILTGDFADLDSLLAWTPDDDEDALSGTSSLLIALIAILGGAVASDVNDPPPFIECINSAIQVCTPGCVQSVTYDPSTGFCSFTCKSPCG